MHRVYLFLILLVFNFGVAAESRTVTIAAASNMSYAMDAILADIHKHHPAADVKVIYGSSGKLTAQILNGAPFDIFLSADMDYPKKLWDEGRALTEPKEYAEGLLVFFTRNAQQIHDVRHQLKQSLIQKVAIANPRTAPYGRAAQEVMKAMQLDKALHDKLVYGENISQTLQFCMTQADAGFIAKAAMFSPHMSRYNRPGVHWVEIDPKLHGPIQQGLVLLPHAQGKPEAREIYDYLLSPHARAVLREYGYR